MKIDLTELLRQLGNEADLEEEIKISFPDDGLTLTSPARVKLHLSNLGPLVSLAGTVEAEAELACSRCGKNFITPLTAKINEEYSKNPPRPAAKKNKEFELKEEDFVYPIEKDNSLDLGEIIRQVLLLAIPIQILCKEEK